MITIIDYEMGNLGSIRNMLKVIGAESKTTHRVEDLLRATKLILPGVGAFGAGMRNLSRLGVLPVLSELVLNRKVPILGICLGMQLMATRSEEGVEPGIGWIDADVVRFDATQHPGMRVPHMGWNTVRVAKESQLLTETEGEQRFYFVHSYYTRCKDRDDVLLQTDYGVDFDAAFARDNLFGVQFHPEKSHRFGMNLLRNFVERC
jgi:glutamine amidotransferase